ncbi:phenoloxidase-activating factor 3-like [Drosophila busckii]|uniref:phenoloxidase-activating factor 3-like n=1 Tax=Drosophila busckii TaxID=30019 RepID=UPI00083F4E1E|nr:phenoloxidase-activating factor 3-like [Drosophila busckii]
MQFKQELLFVLLILKLITAKHLEPAMPSLSARPSVTYDVQYVIGGEIALPKEFASMARLGHRNELNVTNWLCGGTLISNRLVLTAAHCLYSDVGAINIVRLGELDFSLLSDDADAEDFGVRTITEHPDFKYPNLYNDIAIVMLSRVVRFNAYKAEACLPFENGDATSNFIATGWGDVALAGKESSRLMKVELSNYGNNCSLAKDIEELPNGYNATTQLCIGSHERKDTCNGDSGGPALKYNGVYPCIHFIMGITSIGIGCGIPNQPTIYTRVHFYRDWILQHIERSQLIWL